jgi:hypothetical protein
MGEAEAGRQCIEAVRDFLKDEYSPVRGKAMRRDAHPKHHGIVSATFEVGDDIPKDLRHGLFKEPGTHKNAWIRFSNGNPKVQSDQEKDGRGMAIKVCGVEGERASELEALQKREQDFVMIDHPVFFIPDAPMYAPFIRLQSRGQAWRFFLSPFRPRWLLRLRLLRIATRVKKSIASPLENQYFSMSPYKLGPNLAVKFSAKFVGERKATKSAGNDFLREEMVRKLGKEEVCFDFLVQTRTVPRKMAIEDPTLRWSEDLSPYRKVATIRIHKQKFAGPQQMKFAENISYNPWNALMDHAPLGGINRLRHSVYREISKFRHKSNGEDELGELTGDEVFDSED